MIVHSSCRADLMKMTIELINDLDFELHFSFHVCLSFEIPLDLMFFRPDGCEQERKNRRKSVTCDLF